MEEVFRDFKDTAYPFFEADTSLLQCVVCFVFSCLAILRIEGCLNSISKEQVQSALDMRLPSTPHFCAEELHLVNYATEA